MAGQIEGSAQTGELNPEDVEEENDSNYCSSFESDTTSLISAAQNYVFENGRRYHGYKAGKYALPNDEAEQDRMDLMHHCCLLALGGELSLAPLPEKIQRILDIGTGSGIWAIDMADLHPEAQVIGVDLSPIQPKWVPPNVTFEIDDIEEPWQYHPNSFDFIYIRTMAGSISDWPKLYSQAFEALKPGGWIEVHDFKDFYTTDDNSLPSDNILLRWVEMWEDASRTSGREWLSVAPGIVKALHDVGCVEVKERVLKLPIGPWPKEKELKNLGIYWRQHLIDVAEGATLALFTRVLGWEKAQVDQFVVDCRRSLKSTKYHTYSKFVCAYGRKPIAEGGEWIN